MRADLAFPVGEALAACRAEFYILLELIVVNFFFFYCLDQSVLEALEIFVEPFGEPGGHYLGFDKFAGFVFLLCFQFEGKDGGIDVPDNRGVGNFFQFVRGYPAIIVYRIKIIFAERVIIVLKPVVKRHIGHNAIL